MSKVIFFGCVEALLEMFVAMHRKKVLCLVMCVLLNYKQNLIIIVVFLEYHDLCLFSSILFYLIVFFRSVRNLRFLIKQKPLLNFPRYVRGALDVHYFY